jgi:hypothetical protein
MSMSQSWGLGIEIISTLPRVFTPLFSPFGVFTSRESTDANAYESLARLRCRASGPLRLEPTLCKSDGYEYPQNGNGGAYPKGQTASVTGASKLERQVRRARWLPRVASHRQTISFLPRRGERESTDARCVSSDMVARIAVRQPAVKRRLNSDVCQLAGADPGAWRVRARAPVPSNSLKLLRQRIQNLLHR